MALPAYVGIRCLPQTGWKSSPFFLFYFSFLSSPSILFLWPAHKMTGACYQLHSSVIHEPRGVQLCSLLPLALEQTGAKLGSHGQGPAASVLCCSSVETGQKGRRILGFCKSFPGHRTGMQTKLSLEITRRRAPFQHVPLSRGGGCWLLLVKGLMGHGDISAPDILSLVSLIFLGQKLLSQMKGERFFFMGAIPFDYGFKKFIINHLFLSTFPKA